MNVPHFGPPERLKPLLLILIGLTLATYIYRNPTNDDGWFAEQAYWLGEQGIVRSDFFTGVLNWHHQLLVSHKLFLALGAALMELFGTRLVVVQCVGLLFFLILIAEVAGYIKQREPAGESVYLLAILILIFSNRLLIRMSFENRPEMMLAALGFGSFRFIDATKPAWNRVLMGGVLAGLAVLTHLNGLIYAVAGVGMLLYLRQYKSALVFAGIAGLISLGYFIDVAVAKDGFSTWYYQFRHDPATQNAFGLGSKLRVMLAYPLLFLLPLEVMALSLLLIFVGVVQRRYLPLLPPRLASYTLLLVATFWLITKKNSGLYCVLFMPFMLALLYELHRLRPFWTRPLKAVLVIYFVIGLYGTVEQIYQNLSQAYSPSVFARLRPQLPVRSRGLVPLTFFFNDYPHYRKLIAFESYFLRNPNARRSPAHLATWARHEGIGFIVVDRDADNSEYIPPPKMVELGSYRRIYTDGRFDLFTLASAQSVSATPPGRLEKER